MLAKAHSRFWWAGAPLYASSGQGGLPAATRAVGPPARGGRRRETRRKRGMVGGEASEASKGAKRVGVEKGEPRRRTYKRRSGAGTLRHAIRRTWASRTLAAGLRCHGWAPSHHTEPARWSHGLFRRLRRRLCCRHRGNAWLARSASGRQCRRRHTMELARLHDAERTRRRENGGPAARPPARPRPPRPRRPAAAHRSKRPWQWVCVCVHVPGGYPGGLLFSEVG